MKYRADIDGLRALAVLVVVLFHLGFQQLEGGFIGVDVFFVISGFLITQIIETQIDHRKFSLRAFYVRRIRRLIPAMLVTVLTTFIFSLIILAPADFVGFAKSSIGAAFSVSNFVFFDEAGYWDGASELKPLLHTWSLGVEEQFYLIWPALLLLTHRFVSRERKWLIYLGLTILGIGFSELGLRRNPSAAFFLTPFRIFEFSIGALIAHLSFSDIWQRLGQYTIVRDGMHLVGLILILISVLLFRGTTLFPGFNAMVPCAGAALILLSGAGEQGQGKLGTLLLANPLSRWLGQISYSVYLVHWPIVAFYRYETHAEPNLFAQIVMGTLTIILAALLHYQVEKRFWIRSGQDDANRARLPTPRFLGLVGATSLVLSAFSAHAIVNNGWEWRVDDAAFSAGQIKAGMSMRFVHLASNCKIGSFPDQAACRADARVNVMIVGNSHAPDGLNFLRAGYSNQTDVQFVYFGSTNRCELTQTEESAWRGSDDNCEDRISALNNPAILEQFDYLVYAANRPFRADKNSFLDIFKYMKRVNPNLKILLYGGYVNSKVDCSRLINETGRFETCFLAENVNYFEADPSVDPLFLEFSELAHFYIDRVALLCPDRELNQCAVRTPSGIPAYYDIHHASLEFSEWSGRLYAEQFPDLFKE